MAGVLVEAVEQAAKKLAKKLSTSDLNNLSVDELVKMGYPREVAERISSGELPMDEASRMKRLKDQGYDIEYHGTRSDFNQVDPNKVDLGLHTGSIEQANNRLMDTVDGGRGSKSYGDSAQVMPLAIKRGNQMEDMRDIGRWHDSVNVAPELDNVGYDTYDLYEDLAFEKRMADTLPDWIMSRENREGLDKLRGLLTDDGFDTVRYENAVENDLGSKTGLISQLDTVVNDLYAKKAQYMDEASKRMPEPIDMPDPSDPNVEEKLDQWIKATAAKPENFLTDAEKSAIKGIDDEIARIGADPANYNDPRSTINMKPENVRSLLSAAFDPEYKGSNMMGAQAAAGIGTGLLTGILTGAASTYSPESKAGVAKNAAKALELDLNPNRELYHWTGRQDLQEFYPSDSGKFGAGVYLSPDKWYGEKYVRGGEPNRVSVYAPNKIANMDQVEQASIIAQERMKNMEFPGYAFSNVFWDETQKVLKDQGFEGLEYNKEVVVFDPSRLRSPDAAMDKAQRNSTNIFAARPETAVTAGLLAMSPDDASASIQVGQQEQAPYMTPLLSRSIEEQNKLDANAIDQLHALERSEQASGLINNINNVAMTALDMPTRGALSLARLPAGLLAGESPEEAYRRAQQQYLQDSEISSMKMGDSVLKKTGSPELATMAYMTGLLGF
jgi:hypothetical protein